MQFKELIDLIKNGKKILENILDEAAETALREERFGWNTMLDLKSAVTGVSIPKVYLKEFPDRPGELSDVRDAIVYNNGVMEYRPMPWNFVHRDAYFYGPNKFAFGPHTVSIKDAIENGFWFYDEAISGKARTIDYMSTPVNSIFHTYVNRTAKEFAEKLREVIK